MIPVIEYAEVLQRMTDRGFRCNYPNGGSFSFDPKTPTHTRAWIGPPDSTIRPEFSKLILMVEPQYESNLTNGFLRVWKELAPGRLWVMPMSHWHFELNFGSREWLPGLLQKIGVDPEVFIHRSDAAALEFSPEQTEPLAQLVQGLLENLLASDFTIAFCDWPVLCALHHHKQLWWTTADETLAQRL